MEINRYFGKVITIQQGPLFVSLIRDRSNVLNLCILFDYIKVFNK